MIIKSKSSTKTTCPRPTISDSHVMLQAIADVASNYNPRDLDGAEGPCKHKLNLEHFGGGYGCCQRLRMLQAITDVASNYGCCKRLRMLLAVTESCRMGQAARASAKPNALRTIPKARPAPAKRALADARLFMYLFIYLFASRTRTSDYGCCK